MNSTISVAAMLAMFTGALVAWVFARMRPRAADTYTVPISSGLIAGESLMGVTIILVIEIARAWTAVS